MSFYHEVDYRLRELAYNRKIGISPNLRLTEAGNIQKIYELSGAPSVRADFARQAEFFSYTNCDSEAFTISADCSTYEPDENEAEEIDQLLESDANWDTVLQKLKEIIKDYYFYEDSWYLESSYTMQGDCMVDCYEKFEESDELLEWLQDYVREEIRFYTENVHEYFRTAEECREWNLIPDLIRWSNGILDLVGTEWRYSADRMVDELVAEWKKADELIY